MRLSSQLKPGSGNTLQAGTAADSASKDIIFSYAKEKNSLCFSGSK